MNTIVNITGITLKCLGASDESAIKKAKKREIAKRYEQSKKGSVIMLLGKGPDEYQIIGDQKFPFSESAIVRELK